MVWGHRKYQVQVLQFRCSDHRFLLPLLRQGHQTKAMLAYGAAKGLQQFSRRKTRRASNDRRDGQGRLAGHPYRMPRVPQKVASAAQIVFHHRGMERHGTVSSIRRNTYKIVLASSDGFGMVVKMNYRLWTAGQHRKHTGSFTALADQWVFSSVRCEVARCPAASAMRLQVCP